jgi:lambda family phage minor tail protein L
MPIASDIQSTSISPVVELFLLSNYNPSNLAEEFRFTFFRDCKYLGVRWQHIDCRTSGFESNGRTMPRPKIEISNLHNLVGSYVEQYDDLVGAYITRYRTLEAYIQVDSVELLRSDSWEIQQKTGHNAEWISWELAAINIEKLELPKRQYQDVYCGSIYRSPECGYMGLPVADINDVPTTNPALDDCGRKIGSCKLRFGNNAELPIDIFPGISKQ